jgi:hypothetical protein
MSGLTRMSKTQKTFLVSHLENNNFLLLPNKLKPSKLEKFANGCNMNKNWSQFMKPLLIVSLSSYKRTVMRFVTSTMHLLLRQVDFGLLNNHDMYLLDNPLDEESAV